MQNLNHSPRLSLWARNLDRRCDNAEPGILRKINRLGSQPRHYPSAHALGLIPRWWSKPLKEAKIATFNARAETVETKPFFRDALKRTRCLIPASGYYEWQNTPSGKQPWYFTARDGSPALTFAGLWDEWKDRASDETLKSCTMIITGPNSFVAEVHDRMPVILAENDFEPWLRSEAGRRTSQASTGRSVAAMARVKRVNSSKAPVDDPTLIEQITI